MLVEEIRALPGRSGKYRVRLDTGESFVLYRKELSAYGLFLPTADETENGSSAAYVTDAEGARGDEADSQMLSEEAYRRILTETLLPRAKRRALHLLEKTGRTEENLRRKLRESGYPAEVVDDAVSYVMSFHYLDDERYAKNYVSAACEKKSRQRIRQELLQKGLSKELVEEALSEAYTADEEALIRTLLEKKGYREEEADQKTKEKMYRFLLSRGFSSAEVLHALRAE